MLGQIDFAPWQCLAELIDNSIDAFLDQIKSGSAPANPVIQIQLPSEAELKNGTGELSISDNASGMTVAAMTQAVRAGYSGNDPIEKMGLFGMGFNISTARLGRRTEVWSTTVDSEDWVGLIIDFRELERNREFQAPLQTRRKSEAELETPTHGTKIVIKGLESDRIRALTRGNGKRRAKDKLGKIYGQVMVRTGVSILYDGDAVTPWRHCTWDEKRSVETATFGKVPAIIKIDKALEPRPFCTTCWIWLTPGEESCVSCGLGNNLIRRERRLKGWIGIQRYFDKQHFGIDLIRNGRVIQELDKSLFSFVDDSGDSILEYPIDAIHWGGRIVGELEIDFVRVSHQKDSFDKLDPEWKHVVEIVRGTSPMQPRIAERMGLPKNDSPLARMFTAYRKVNAGLKDLVPGNAKGVGLNSGLVTDYVAKFYAGDSAYQTDEKWYELVLQAERAKRGDSAGADDAAGEFPVDIETPQVGQDPAAGGDRNIDDPTEPPRPQPEFERDLELSRTYEVTTLPGSPAIRVEAYKHFSDVRGKPYSVVPDGYSYRFDYNIRSPFFEESLDTPAACLVVDLAQHFLAVSAESPRNMPVSAIVRTLQERYFPSDATTLSGSAETGASLLLELRRHLDESLPEAAPISVGAIDVNQLEHVRRVALRTEGASTPDTDRLVSEGKFAKYVQLDYLSEIVKQWPELVMDGRFFSVPYISIEQEKLRAMAVSDICGCIEDVVWLSDAGGSALSKDAGWRLRYSRSLASLRLLTSWRS
jgi:hypothetical protein